MSWKELEIVVDMVREETSPSTIVRELSQGAECGAKQAREPV